MRFSAFALSWLTVPLAAAAGFFYGSQARMAHNALPADRQAIDTAPPGLSPVEPTTRPTSGMKAWADRLRNCGVRELPGFYGEMAALMKELKTRDEAGMALQLLCARWAELDAPGGMAFFTRVQESETNPREKDSWSRIWLLTEWALRDPQAAGRAVHALPDKEAQGEILNVGMQLLRENPDKFWIWFQQNHKPLPSTWRVREPNWSVVVGAHFEEFSVIAAGMLAAPEPADPKDKRWRQSELEELHGLLAARRAGQDADQALAWAKALPESLRSNALKGVLEVVAAKSPEKIGDFLLLLKDKQMGANAFAESGASEIVRKAMATMGSRDPLGLVDWLRVNTNKLGHEGIYGHSERVRPQPDVQFCRLRKFQFGLEALPCQRRK